MDKCQICQTQKGQELHDCPYVTEIGSGYNPEYCNCCSDCVHECCMAI